MISAFFDESGKFKDASTISIVGVASDAKDVDDFADEWQRHLRLNGMKALHMMQDLRHRLPLSAKRPALGVKNRIDALMPFVGCIRQHIQSVVGVAVDVDAFKQSPSHLRMVWGDDPVFMAFTRALVEIMQPLRPGEKLNVVCDEDEGSADSMYKLYRRVKVVYSDARNRLASLSFADDQVFCALQASDMVASLFRHQAMKVFHGKEYDYQPLWDALAACPARGERLWGLSGCFAGMDNLQTLADSEWRRQQIAKKSKRNRSLIDSE